MYSWLKLCPSLNESQFFHGFPSYIHCNLPSVTWTLTGNNFCFPSDYHLPIRHCGQTISSTAESQRVTHFKVSLQRKHKGTSKIHEITQYPLHKLYRLSIEFHEVPTDDLLRSKILLQFTNPSGLSLRAGGRGFSPAAKRVAPSYFYWKIEEK